MKFYINENGERKQVSRGRIKLEAIKEQYRLHLIRIFIVKLCKKYSYVFKFMISFILWLSILIIGILSFGDRTHADLHTSVKYGQYNQAVTVYDSQVAEMIKRGYSNTRILDILMAKNMECHQYNGDCTGYLRDKNWKLVYPLKIVDYGPFQINQIHEEQFNTSLKYKAKQDWAGLYKYQLTYANDLIQSYMDRYCDWKRSKTNEIRAKCVYKSYNGSKNKDLYAEIAWLKRQIISDYLFNKG